MELLESGAHFSSLPLLWRVRFLFVGLDKEEVYLRKVDTRDELLARILDAAARIIQREQLRRKTRDSRTQVAKRVQTDGGIFEHLLWTVKKNCHFCATILSFEH
jgi:hypothetical protein